MISGVSYVAPNNRHDVHLCMYTSAVPQTSFQVSRASLLTRSGSYVHACVQLRVEILPQTKLVQNKGTNERLTAPRQLLAESLFAKRGLTKSCKQKTAYYTNSNNTSNDYDSWCHSRSREGLLAIAVRGGADGPLPLRPSAVLRQRRARHASQ